MWSSGCVAQGEDIFDRAHSAKYARHLIDIGQFAWAADEYKYLLTFEPLNDTFQYSLLNAYRRASLYKEGLQNGGMLLNSNPYSAAKPAKEYVNLMLLSDSTMMALRFLNYNKTIDSTQKARFCFETYMIAGDWPKARQVLNTDKEMFTGRQAITFDSLLYRAEHLHRKSAFLAGTLSTVLPGTGQMYVGNVKDGLYATLIVAIMGYTAYDGFRIKGTRSAMGWIFGGLTVGFYGGNIYGAVKAAKRYLPWKNHLIIRDAKNIIYPGL